MHITSQQRRPVSQTHYLSHLTDSRSIHPIDIRDILLQVFPDLRELAARRADHVELADDSTTTKVKADETDDSDLRRA